jgi:hypothetical protein
VRERPGEGAPRQWDGRSTVLEPRSVRVSNGMRKFSRWPHEAKRAFCFAGDLDALSLRDYGRRLDPRSARRERPPG